MYIAKGIVVCLLTIYGSTSKSLMVLALWNIVQHSFDIKCYIAPKRNQSQVEDKCNPLILQSWVGNEE
jgi:hypothetical protein